MKIIEPTFEILHPNANEHGIRQLQFIEQMARISHRSEDRQTPDSWKRFIQFVVMEKGDWSVVEHSSSTVIFRVDRGITHELVRHRLFSFTQESTRFINYAKKGEVEVIRPSFEGDKYNFEWETACHDAETSYFELVQDGCPPQLARSVLPTGLAATIAVTGNLR